MWWHFVKKSQLSKLKYEMFLHSSQRSLKTRLIIQVIEDLIEDNRDKLQEILKGTQFNPLNDTSLILHIVKNYQLLNHFPKHKYYIKNILLIK